MMSAFFPFLLSSTLLHRHQFDHQQRLMMQEFLISSSIVIYQLAFYFSLLNGGLVSVELAVSCMSAGR